MGLVQIRKKSGGFRTIMVPSKARKQACREIMLDLMLIARKHCDPQVVHGFAELRSPVTNALAHRGFRYTVSFDLKDFFDTVRIPRGHPLDKYRKIICDREGITRQGLPTSPIVANIMAAPMDAALKQLGAVYTRYADDLSFSTNDIEVVHRLMNQVGAIVAKHGFMLNDAKTELQDAKRGRRIICGVAVDDEIHATRKAKRKLRAARHQGARRSANGLAEWVALKIPRIGKKSLSHASELSAAETLKFLSQRPGEAK